jgi:hypothetical protein
MKIMGIILFLVLMIGYAYADNPTQSRYPVRKGDVLVFETTFEDHDDKGNVVVYNDEGNAPERIKRTITVKRVKVKKVDNGLKYGFPLKVGLQWDCNREGKRPPEDHSNCSYVESQEVVAVPAGVFEGCFKVVYDTLPGTVTEWYRPGVGVVKSEYIHHGTMTNEIVVLKKIIWK